MALSETIIAVSMTMKDIIVALLKIDVSILRKNNSSLSLINPTTYSDGYNYSPPNHVISPYVLLRVNKFD